MHKGTERILKVPNYSPMEHRCTSFDPIGDTISLSLKLQAYPMNKLLLILILALLCSCSSKQEEVGQESRIQEEQPTLSDLSTHESVPDNESDEDAESDELRAHKENTFPVYFESVMSNSMRHWGGLNEYFQLSEISDSVIGVGVGISDGDPLWEFDFSGKIIHDSIYIVHVNYRQEGYPSVSNQEKWVRNRQTGEFFLSGYNRPNEGRRYVLSEIDDFPPFIRDSLRNLDKRLDR